MEQIAGGELRCPLENHLFSREDGIWRFLLPERRAYFQQFIQEYETVRRAEGRGSENPDFYRALPFADLTGRRRADWRIRARSYTALIMRLLLPLENGLGRPLSILDAGAGNGWLSNRLAQRGHAVAAVDLLTNPLDGLGAFVNYETMFTPIQAEFDRLPFSDGQFDLLIFNASFHYSVDYALTLREALRVLGAAGRLALLDSPVYQDFSSGERMVRQREAEFERNYGFPSNSLPSQNYLTFSSLAGFGDRLNIHWELVRPFYGLRWLLRPWKARLLHQREPAKFVLIVGKGSKRE